MPRQRGLGAADALSRIRARAALYGHHHDAQFRRRKSKRRTEAIDPRSQRRYGKTARFSRCFRRGLSGWSTMSRVQRYRPLRPFYRTRFAAWQHEGAPHAHWTITYPAAPTFVGNRQPAERVHETKTSSGEARTVATRSKPNCHERSFVACKQSEQLSHFWYVLSGRSAMQSLSRKHTN